MDTKLKKQLSEIVSESVKWDCPLGQFTSFQIGGPADAVVSVKSREELHKLIIFLGSNSLDWRVLGRGTNLLVMDSGYRGVAILLDGKFKSVEFFGEDHTLVHAGAGFGLSRLSSLCMERGLSGLEFAIGIPGTIGGAAVMNAGAWGRDLGGVLAEVEIMTQEGPRTYVRDDLDFSYRSTSGFECDAAVVSSVCLRLMKRDAQEIRRACKRYSELRNKQQPKGANAGSFFKNPGDDSAGRLIDASGLKGLSIGGAVVSEKHANFIINRGNAKASDVLRLMELIQNKVQKDSGVFLEPEVHILC